MARLIEDRIRADDPAFLYLNLHPNEEVKLIIRHHWAGFLSTLALTLSMIVVPLVIFFAAHSALKTSLDQLIPYIALTFSAFILFILTFLLGSWINYYYDVIFITSERIINVDQEGLLARRTSELNIKQVQDVSAEVNGFLRSIFDFGLLIVETAGEDTSAVEKGPHGMEGYFTIDDIPDPNRVARIIIELHRASIRGGDLSVIKNDNEIDKILPPT